MCLSLNFHRIVGDAEIKGLFAIGCASLSLTIYLQTETKGIQGEGLLIALFIISIFIIIDVIIGAQALVKKNVRYLFLYNIGIIVLFIAFMVLMISGSDQANSTSFEIKNDCNYEKSTLNKVFETYSALLCGSTCECYYQGQTPLYHSQFNYSNTNNQLPTQVQECPTYKEMVGSDESYVNILAQVEKDYGCSGWCSTYSQPVFVNINQPLKDQSACAELVVDSLQTIASVIIFGQAILIGLMGLFIIFKVCFWFNPATKDKGYYEKLDQCQENVS